MTAATGRLSLWRAAFVVARRDFGAILFSRAFIFFLLGPLFPVAVMALAGGVGAQVGTRSGVLMKAEQLRILLAILVLLVCGKLATDLLLQPSELYSIGADGH